MLDIITFFGLAQVLQYYIGKTNTNNGGGEMKNYRDAITAIADRYNQPGEDLARGILEGAPTVIDADEALGIADWLDNEADEDWRVDPRHQEMAQEIRDAVNRDEAPAD